MQGAYANVLEVGRCLIEAKEANVVPHGQWEAWVQRTAGMSERTAQRLMQAAREVSPESAMARLPISKITAILALPEPQREAVAVKAVEENQSLRELQATIDEMREELHQTRRQVTKANLERDNAIAVLDKAQKRRAAFESECNELRRQVQGIKEAPATGISKEAQARIDSLTKQKEALAAQLADAEKMAEYQARQREQAQAELLDLRTQTARGELPIQEDLTAEAVGMAARTFMGAVGYVPHSDKLVTLRDADRQEIATYATMLQRWTEDVLRVINNTRDAVIIEGV
jgi:chromosome segregation ATPase